MLHTTVCICTFKRPQLLRRLLEKLEGMDCAGLSTYSVVIVDNDSNQSARTVALDFARQSSIEIVYDVEHCQNIALARNRALSHARGDYVALIDDDEYPTENWLSQLLTTCMTMQVDGVLGPVKPEFEREPADWILRGRLFDRPTHATGHFIEMADARTGNVLLRRGLFDGIAEPFAPRFGNGGEDVDFFQRMMAKGARFVWCDEAVVFETVPVTRCTRRYMLRRALLRGCNSIKQRRGRANKLARSFLALPAYVVALPFLFLAGQHYFMTYLIKSCDHLGRVMAWVGICPVGQRD